MVGLVLTSLSDAQKWSIDVWIHETLAHWGTDICHGFYSSDFTLQVSFRTILVASLWLQPDWKSLAVYDEKPELPPPPPIRGWALSFPSRVSCLEGISLWNFKTLFICICWHARALDDSCWNLFTLLLDQLFTWKVKIHVGIIWLPIQSIPRKTSQDPPVDITTDHFSSLSD